MQHTKSSVVKDRKDRKATEGGETPKNPEKNTKGKRDSLREYQPSRLSANASALALEGKQSTASP